MAQHVSIALQSYNYGHISVVAYDLMSNWSCCRQWWAHTQHGVPLSVYTMRNSLRRCCKSTHRSYVAIYSQSDRTDVYCACIATLFVACLRADRSHAVVRNKVKYAQFRKKRMNTNPCRGPFHFRSPARIFWRTVSGCKKTKRRRLAQLFTCHLHLLRECRLDVSLPWLQNH